jgi:hypothetical protein
MKPYTVIVHMNNSDIVLWHGWADDAAQARELIVTTYEENGWYQDVAQIIVRHIPARKHAGFTLVTQMAGAKL